MTRYVNPQPRYVNKNGKALAGGKLNFYSAGTVTRRNTYSDSAFTIPNTNPVILDAEGRPEVNIFLDGVYKVVLTDSDDQVIWEKDPVGGVIGIQAFADWISDATYNIGDIVTASDGKYYRSVTNGNVGLDPTVESDDWERVQLLREWRTALVYQTDDIVVGSDDIIYQSLTDENSANDPVSDKTNWSSVKDYWGAADGVATLDSSGLVPSSQIPPIAITDVYVVANQVERLALDAQVGDIAVQNDNNTAYILQTLPASTNANWVEFGIQGFGSAAFRDVGTASTNIPDISTADARYLNQSSNLGDLPNAGTARNNLGLGSAATRNVGTDSDAQIPDRGQADSRYFRKGVAVTTTDFIFDSGYYLDSQDYQRLFIGADTASFGFVFRNSNNSQEVNFRGSDDVTYLGVTDSANSKLSLLASSSPIFSASYTGGSSSNNQGDVYSQFLFETTDNNFGVGAQAFIKAIHTRAGTGHSNQDAGLIFGTSASTSDAIAVERMRINAVNGRVGIGTTDPSSLLHVNGDVTANNYFPPASDERLKNKLRPVVINYRQAAALQSWVFQWKDMEAIPESQRGKIEIGLMAQDILKVFPPEQYPSLVIKKDNCYYTIDPDKILMMRVFAKVEPRIVTWYKDLKRWLGGK